MVRMNRPSVKLCRRKQIHAGFAVAPQTTKVMATVQGKCSVKMEKALNLYVTLRVKDHILITFITVIIIIVLLYH